MAGIRRHLRRLLHPRRVDVSLPRRFEAAHELRLMTAGGRDQIAIEVAARGWNSFERPLPDLIATWRRA